MPEYKPVPVEAAVSIAEQFAKSRVAIWCFDAEHERHHFTSYGVMPTDKEVAAEIADRLAKEIVGEVNEDWRSYEDFIRSQLRSNFPHGPIKVVAMAHDNMILTARAALESAKEVDDAKP